MARVFIAPGISVPHPCGPDANDWYTDARATDCEAGRSSFGELLATLGQHVLSPSELRDAARLADTLNPYNVYLTDAYRGTGPVWLAWNEERTVFWHRDIPGQRSDVYIRGRRFRLHRWLAKSAIDQVTELYRPGHAGYSGGGGGGGYDTDEYELPAA